MQHALGERNVVMSIVSAAWMCHPRPQIWKLASVNSAFRAAVQHIAFEAARQTFSHWFPDPRGMLGAMRQHSAMVTGTQAAFVAVQLGFECAIALPGEQDTITFFLPHGGARWEVGVVARHAAYMLTELCSCFCLT